MASWDAQGLSPRAANVLLPGDLSVVGPAVGRDRLETYLTETMRRVRELGIGRVIFGSGTARSIPDGFPADQGREQYADAARLAAADVVRFQDLFEHLAAFGYQGRCSIECRWDDLESQAAVRAGADAAELV